MIARVQACMEAECRYVHSVACIHGLSKPWLLSVNLLMKGSQMKRFGFIGLTVMMMMVAAPASVFADSHTDAIAVFKSSPAVMPFFETAYGYAVFPTVGKGGLFVGGTYGKGKVFRGDTTTGTATLIKLSLGWQVGGQAFREIIFFEDQRAYDEFTRGTFDFDANASAVAITAGLQAQDPWARQQVPAWGLPPENRPAPTIAREWPFLSMPSAV